MAEEKKSRNVPLNDLDFNMSLTRPVIGTNEVDSKFTSSLTKQYFQYDEKGNMIFQHNKPSCKKQIQIKEKDGIAAPYCPFCNVFLKVEEIEPMLSEKALWSQLGYFTQDMRLSNLSEGNIWKGLPNEVEYCEYRLNLANDLLSEGYDEPFIICLERVAAKLELCQSKGGFLRRRMGTYTQENKSEVIEPANRKIPMGSKGY